MWVCRQSGCRLAAGQQPLRRGVGVGSKAGEQLPDLSIYPPLGLIHLGTRRGRTGKEQRRTERTP